MRRLVAGASALCCTVVAFLPFAVGADLARASGWRDLDARIAELEQTTACAGSRRLAVGKTTFYADHRIYRNFSVGAILSVVDGAVTPWASIACSGPRPQRQTTVSASVPASMLVCAQAHFHDPTIVVSACVPPGCAFDPAQSTTKLLAASWQGFVIGARIQS